MIGMTLQRQRMTLAWLLISALLAWLAVREGLQRWDEMRQWQVMAESLPAAGAHVPIGPERLRQSAAAAQLEVSEVAVDGDGWRVQGRAADAPALQRWLLSVQADGARPVQWSLVREAKGLSFSVQVQR